MNLSSLSFIGILVVTTVTVSFAATTGGLRHQPIATPGEEFVIALSDADELDSDVDASNIVLDAASTCIPKGGFCGTYGEGPCCLGEYET